MKIRVLMAAVLSLAAGALLAEPPRGGIFDIERLTILLDLDEAQAAEVSRVLEEQRQQMTAFREQAKESQTRPTREQLFALLEQRRAETIDKLRPILTDQQLKKFEVLARPPDTGRMPWMHPDPQR